MHIIRDLFNKAGRPSIFTCICGNCHSQACVLSQSWSTAYARQLTMTMPAVKMRAALVASKAAAATAAALGVARSRR